MGPLPGDTAVNRRFLVLLLAGLLTAGFARAIEYGEFSSDGHRPVIWSLHASLNSRDYGDDQFKFLDSLGFGFELYFLINRDPPYTPHKLLYFYVDNDVSGMFKKQLVYTLTPGFMVRTYLPFLKLSYGAGPHVKIGHTHYPAWGVYGQAIVDFHRFFIGSRIIFHPGSDRIENEIQFGYLFSGRYK